MTPYSSTNVYKLQQFLHKIYMQIISSEEFKVACGNINQSPTLLTNNLFEKFLSNEFPEILEESKLVDFPTKKISKNDTMFPFSSVKYFLNSEASEENYARAITTSKNRLFPLLNNTQSVQPKREDYLIYDYYAYRILIPVSGSHEIALCVISPEWSFNPHLVIWELNINLGYQIKGKYNNGKAGFAEIELYWPLPEKPANLSQEQIEVFKNRVRDTISILKYSFNRARKNYTEWQESSKTKITEMIETSHTTKRLRIQRIENERLRHNEALKKLTDI